MMKIPVELDEAQLTLLTEALDSHKYWQLAESQYRNNGYVNAPGSDDEDDAKSILDVEDLEGHLEKAKIDLERRRKLGEKLTKAKRR